LTPILFQVNDGDCIYEVNIESIVNGYSHAYINGNIFPFEIRQYYGEIFEKLTEKQQSQKKAIIRAPMPGLISRIKVKTGQFINAGESLLILEAMKMENEMKSPIDGIIKQINVEVGTTIDKETILLTIENQ
jgi:biotin carboxyl carrier protein